MICVCVEMLKNRPCSSRWQKSEAVIFADVKGRTIFREADCVKKFHDKKKF